MNRNQTYPETRLELHSHPFSNQAGNLEKRSFTRITKSFFYYITIFGFRTFALPDESCTFAYCSICGLIFLLPALGIAGFYVHSMFKAVVQYTDLYGFFSGQVSVMFELLFCYMFQLAYLILSLLSTKKLNKLISTLDTLSVSAKSLKQLSFFHNITLLFTTVTHITVSAIIIISFNDFLKIGGATSLKFINYLTFCSMAYSNATLLFPLNFLGLVVFFLGKAFDEHLASLRSIPKNKSEDQLPWFYLSYIKLANVLEEVDSFFGWVIFGLIGIALINISTFVLNIGNSDTMPLTIIYAMVFLMIFDFLCCNFLCTWLNEKSRALAAELYTILPHNPNIFIWVETFQRKISDTSWGLTLGKFFLMERTAFIGLISAMVTFLALYGQFSQTSASPKNATSADPQCYVQG